MPLVVTPSPSGQDVGRVGSWHEVLAEAVMLPAQFFARARPETAERRLCLAILEDAVRCATAPIVSPRERRLAWEWLASPDGGPYSARYLCEVLDLEHEPLVRGVAALRRRAHAGERVTPDFRRVAGTKTTIRGRAARGRTWGGHVNPRYAG